jgi:GMP synthase (glutamine-hydrolysing)
MKRGFLIIDFGSQFTQLIARRFRELGYYSEILSYKTPTAEIKAKNPYGIVLSGGPNSVSEETSPRRPVRELVEIAPVLGVCYGMQLIAFDLGGQVEKATHREYGLMPVHWESSWGAVPREQSCWMSHGDIVKAVPPGFKVAGKSTSGHLAAMESERVWAVQFHPEVSHTQQGVEVLKAFAADLGKAQADWDAPQMGHHFQRESVEKVGPTDQVLCALSGGVDSTVVATLLTKTLGKERVHCIFVDNGLLRKHEFETVLENYHKLGLDVKGVPAVKEFMSELKGVYDPELKRKTIGRLFIEVFEKSMQNLPPSSLITMWVVCRKK